MSHFQLLETAVDITGGATCLREVAAEAEVVGLAIRTLGARSFPAEAAIPTEGTTAEVECPTEGTTTR